MSQETLTRVVDCLVATTRYPRELLVPDAELENGLGIDSVKRLELVIALGEEFGIDLQAEEYDPSIRTIADVANWIEQLRNGPHANGQPPAEQRPVPAAEEPNGPVNRISSPEPLSAPHYPVAERHAEPVAERNAKPAPTARPLEGRVALVTGSGRGVGRAVARLLADRGATVIVNSFHSREQGEQTAEEINAHGGRAVHLWGSIANPEHVDAIFKQIEQRFGLDILICNASDGRIGPFLELTPDDWDRAFRTNVSGHYQCAVRAAELMRPRGGGAMVTMSAVGAHQHIEGLGSQGVVKAAVESLTRYLACALGPSGVRVNCVVGGPVYGELLDKFPEARAAQHHWESMTPDGELCTPLDLARTIAFLVSDEARGINGAVWMVDHGFSATAEGHRHRRTAPQVLTSTNGQRVEV